MERHLTVSGFVVHEGRVALHWHRKIGMWLPAGGHLEPGEDPLEAVLRETREEFAVEAAVLPIAPRVEYASGPAQVEPPYTILLENVEGCGRTPDGRAVHIDMVYFLHLRSGYPGRSYDADNPIYWFDIAGLEAGAATHDGINIAFPPDVQALGIEAIRLAVAAIVAGPA